MSVNSKKKTPAGVISRIDVRAAIILICILVLAAIFLIDLVRTNRNAAVKKQEVLDNQNTVMAYNFGNVADVEAVLTEIDEERAAIAAELAAIQADEAENGPNYRRIFEGCSILGDSITEGLVVYGYLGEDIVVSGIGAGISQDRFLSVASLYPKCAFFSYGMNDMGNYRGDAKAFIADYEAALNAFIKESPKTRIYVNSISLPDDSAIEDQPVLGNYEAFNAEIRSMCDRLGMTYIDTTYILKNDPDLYAGDGIHVVSEYYPIWLELMRESAGLV